MAAKKRPTLEAALDEIEAPKVAKPPLQGLARVLGERVLSAEPNSRELPIRRLKEAGMSEAELAKLEDVYNKYPDNRRNVLRFFEPLATADIGEWLEVQRAVGHFVGLSDPVTDREQATLDASMRLYLYFSEKGQPAGIAELDGEGHLPMVAVPPSVANSSAARSKNQCYVWDGTEWKPQTITEAKQWGIYPLEAFESLQAAMNYVNAHGGGAVALPAGATPVGAGLEMKHGTFLIGPPGEWDVQGFSNQTAWLEGTAESESPIITFPKEVHTAGLRDIAILGSAAHPRQGIVTPEEAFRGGNTIRRMQIRKCGTATLPAVLIGTKEFRGFGVLVMEAIGPGVLITAEDGIMDWLQVGQCGGTGVEFGTAVAAYKGRMWDIYDNENLGIVLNGERLRLFDIQVNSNYKGGVKFAEVRQTMIHGLISTGNCLAFKTTGERYSDVIVAGVNGNEGCGIIGGAIEASEEPEEPGEWGIDNKEGSVKFFTLLGVSFHGKYHGSATLNGYIHTPNNCSILGCNGVPNTSVARGTGVPNLLLRGGSSGGQLGVANAAGSTVAGFKNQAGLYQSFVEQELAANGAVKMEAEKGNFFQITLKANATSSEITTATKGQELTIEWLQDTTGARTYVWPANCKFAEGKAPTASTEKGYRDSVTFRYDGTNWVEKSRAIGIH